MATSNRTVVLRLYKSLLKVAQSIDKNPISKLMIHRATWEYNDQSPAAKHYSSVLTKVLNHQKVMDPYRDFKLASIVQEEFRRSDSSEEDITLDSKIDVAF